jgi:hypothetical protein
VSHRGARTTALLLGATLALALAAGPVAATSPEPSPKLSGKDLPTSAQLAAVYPKLAGGVRDVYKALNLEVPSGPDCVRLRTIGRPSSAVGASYYDADGDDPYYLGGEAASAVVHEFDSEQAAHRTMARLGRYLDRCDGSHQAFGTRNKLTTRDAPPLGDESLAYAISIRFFDSGTGGSTSRELHVVVREGNLLVDAHLRAEKFVPSLANGGSVAELTLASSP